MKKEKNIPSLNEDTILKFVNRIIISLGIFCLIYFYFNKYGLWLDEAAISYSFTKDGYAHLLKPLPLIQISPIGFLFVEKFFFDLIPSDLVPQVGEYFLRAPTIIVSICLLFFVHPFTYKLTKNKYIATIALAIFAFNEIFIYYSAEVKPYIWEVLFAMLILYFHCSYSENKSFKNKFWLIFAMSTSILFSLSSVIIMFIIALWDFILLIKSKKNFIDGCIKLIKLYIIPFISVLTYYFAFIFNNPNTILSKAIRDDSLNLSTSLNQLIVFNNILFYPLIALGLFSLFHNNKNRNIKIGFIFLGVLIVHNLLHYMQIYPVRTRLLVYFLPILSIILAQGFFYTFQKLNSFIEKKFVFSIKNKIFISMLIIMVSSEFSYHNITNYIRLNFKVPLDYILTNKQDNDAIYVQDAGINFPDKAVPNFSMYKDMRIIIPPQKNLNKIFGEIGFTEGFFFNDGSDVNNTPIISSLAYYSEIGYIPKDVVINQMMIRNPYLFTKKLREILPNIAEKRIWLVFINDDFYNINYKESKERLLSELGYGKYKILEEHTQQGISWVLIERMDN